MNGEQRMWTVIVGVVAFVIVLGALAITYSAINYDNKRMQYGYCETLMPGTAQRFLVKCGGTR